MAGLDGGRFRNPLRRQVEGDEPTVFQTPPVLLREVKRLGVPDR